MSVGLNVWSTTASNNSTSDTNINWAEGMAPSQVNDSARAMMASMAKWRDDNNGTLVTSGSTTAYTLAASNQVEAALTAGYTIAFQIHATNDSSATLNVDGLGAKPLQVITGTNLQGGELVVGNIYRATYSTTGTGQWIVNNAVQPGSQANIINTTNIADNAVTYQKIQTPGASVLLGNPSTSTSTGYREITLGANLTFSGTTLVAGGFSPVITIITSTATATWQSTTQSGHFPLYLLVRMAGGGGGGASSNNTAGSSGTDTTFNNWTAVAGNKSTGGGAGGSGGSGGANGTGTLIRRLTGQAGSPFAGSGIVGGGGNSALGGAGPPNNSTGVAAVANTGSGGAGSNNSGGGGAEYVEFIVTSPSTAYTLQVGPGGAGGVGGTNGAAGAAGRIEVIAYWQ